MKSCKLSREYPNHSNVIQNGEGHGCYGCTEVLDSNINKNEYLRCKTCPWIQDQIKAGNFIVERFCGPRIGSDLFVVRDAKTMQFIREWVGE